MENESLQTREIMLTSLERGTRKHGESLPGNSASPGMGAAIRRLIPGRITRESLLDLFDQRASHKAIEAWRYGWRGAPQWAVDLIQGKLAARAAADLAAGAKLKPGNRGSGAAGAKALAAWRERKAQERDEKAARDKHEKAIWQQYAKTKWASEDGTAQGRDDEKKKAATEAAAPPISENLNG